MNIVAMSLAVFLLPQVGCAAELCGNDFEVLPILNP
jgi:hypothetical protein